MKRSSLLATTITAILLGNAVSAQTVTGSGTANYMTKFTGTGVTSTVGSSSLLYDSGTRIGINTTTPGAILQLNSSSPNDGLRIYQTTTSASSLQLWHTSLANGAHNWNIYSTDINNTIWGGAGNFVIYDATSTTVPMIIKGTTGLVGLGTIAPTERLDVNGGNMIVRGPLGFANAGNTATFYLGNTSNFINATNNGNIDFGINGVTALSISKTQRVGIGTMNPTALLTVNGKTLIGDPTAVNIATIGNYNLYVQNGILTEKVRVAVNGSANWADYVFEPGYRLAPLTEVESFVATNHHLPGVPSACEVADNGIDMAEMDATLLKKIEELTLYVIEQNKKLEAQQLQIQQMQLKLDGQN